MLGIHLRLFYLVMMNRRHLASGSRLAVVHIVVMRFCQLIDKFRNLYIEFLFWFELLYCYVIEKHYSLELLLC